MADVPTEWFARRTYHHRRFDAAGLVEAKHRQGVTISACIPALNEAETIGPIVAGIRRHLMEELPLLDELVVVDSASIDQTCQIAEDAGAVVIQDRDVLPDEEPLSGKGEAMWKSLFVLRGDLIAWLDGDIRNFEPRFLTGILGPLLTDPDIGYVKAFYERPMMDGDRLTSLEGGRVTEIMARPLLNLFWPELAGIVQPLSGEYAGRRTVLERIPFFTGYGVEIGMLIDVVQEFGLDTIAQVDLERRVHRNRYLGDLSRMAFAILQTAVQRLASSGRVELRTELDLGFYQFLPEGGRYRMEPALIDIRERPPAETIAAYRAPG